MSIPTRGKAHEPPHYLQTLGSEPAHKLHRIDSLCQGILADSKRVEYLDSGDAIRTFEIIRAIIAGRL